ncbi:MAG: S41 family peptidase [Silvanigrellaceae bacterium]
MIAAWFSQIKARLSKPTRPLFWLLGLTVGFYPSSSDRLGSIWFPTFGLSHDFSAGHAVVPLEEIFPGLSFDTEAEVIRHALRIVEQHYVQRERLDAVRMLSSGIRALGREHGADIELGFVKRGGQSGGMQLSGYRTLQLCPSMTRQSADICPESGIESSLLPSQENFEVQAVLRVGLRVFGVPLSVEPGLRSLDLVGRYVVPEYARLRGIPVSQAVHTYLNGILDELDPHSSYMSLDEYKELRSGTRGQFGGVGLVIDEAQELPVIREVVPNSPAHMAGIRSGDVLLRVGNNVSAFRPLESVLRDIRELAVDTAAPVWFFRPSSRRVFRSFLAREEIPTRSAELRIVEGHPEVLHIRVTGFANHTADDVYALFEHAQQAARGKLKMMLLDLRGNPGGLLDQAIQVSDLFLRHGKIVSTRSRFEEQIEQATRGTKIDLPVVTLVNSSSASASEIVAGALKDQGRSLIVGERTFGKGSVQSLFELSTGTALKLTVAHYFTPAGQSLQGVGVEPHVGIKLVQPREDHLWMSGSSEIDREEHLASHLLNPTKSRTGSGAHQLSLNLWALSRPEVQVLGGLRPLNFAYPIGDNTRSITKLDEDPIARVGVQMGLILYSGRTQWQPLTERQIRDAHRKVLAEEATLLRSTLEQEPYRQIGLWKTLPKSFFEFASDERPPAVSSSYSKASAPLTPTQPPGGKGGNRTVGGTFRDFMTLFGILGKTGDSPLGPSRSLSRVSLSSNALIAWQGSSQVLLSIAASEVRAQAQRNGTLAGLLGLRLDDSHDGPVVWLPVQFSRTADKQWMSTVRLPRTIRTYLSTVPSALERASVVGQVKWKLGDEPTVLGPLQMSPLARRHGRLVGQLSERDGHKILHLQFTRLADVGSRPESAVQLSARSAVLPSTEFPEMEVLIASLSDDRVMVETEVVPLQRVGEGDYRGETELKMSPVINHGLGFSGIVGGIVRSSAGDILQTTPLLWIGDEGVFPLDESNSLRSTTPVEW